MLNNTISIHLLMCLAAAKTQYSYRLALEKEKHINTEDVNIH
jgi:hypothetical protein